MIKNFQRRSARNGEAIDFKFDWVKNKDQFKSGLNIIKYLNRLSEEVFIKTIKEIVNGTQNKINKLRLDSETLP